MSTRDYSRRRRKRSYSLTGIIVFLIAAGIFLLLSTTVFFNVETIQVTGSSNYTAQEIIDASGIKAGDNLVRTSTDKCAEKIESSLVYIEKADITRSFPNTMIINVEACVPAANFLCGDSTLLISGGGKILEQISEPKAGLLNFTGTDPEPGLLPGDEFISADEHKTAAIEKLMEYFDSEESSSDGLREKITLVDVSDRSDLSYTYDGRITVKLGSINDIEYKIKFSHEIISTKIGEKTEGVLTILSDSKGASFLDKESLEHNAQVYSDNMSAQTAATDENGETVSETAQETTKADPIME